MTDLTKANMWWDSLHPQVKIWIHENATLRYVDDPVKVGEIVEVHGERSVILSTNCDENGPIIYAELDQDGNIKPYDIGIAHHTSCKKL